MQAINDVASLKIIPQDAMKRFYQWIGLQASKAKKVVLTKIREEDKKRLL